MSDANYTPRLRRRGPSPAQSHMPKTLQRPIAHILFGRGRELLKFPFSGRLVAGMTEAAQELGIPFTVMEMPDMTKLPPLLLSREFAGCTAAGHPPSAGTSEAFHPLPVVWAGSGAGACPQLDQVAGDSHQEGILAARYLLERGCRRPAYINHATIHTTFESRQLAFCAEMKRNGLASLQFLPDAPPLPEQEAWQAPNLRHSLSMLLDQLLSQSSRPDGIFLPTDQQAAMTHTLLRERGIEPEKDIVLISCNNDEPWLATMHPRSATIDTRPDQIGREAVRRLVTRIQHPNEAPAHLLIQPALVRANQ